MQMVAAVVGFESESPGVCTRPFLGFQALGALVFALLRVTISFRVIQVLAHAASV